MAINGKRELMNCLGCGRDTKAIHGYCSRCCGIHKPYCTPQQMPRETKDRETFHIDGDSFISLFNADIHEDDYSENAMAPIKRDEYVTGKEENAHYQKMKRKIESASSDLLPLKR